MKSGMADSVNNNNNNSVKKWKTKELVYRVIPILSSIFLVWLKIIINNIETVSTFEILLIVHILSNVCNADFSKNRVILAEHSVTEYRQQKILINKSPVPN